MMMMLFGDMFYSCSVFSAKVSQEEDKRERKHQNKERTQERRTDIINKTQSSYKLTVTSHRIAPHHNKLQRG